MRARGSTAGLKVSAGDAAARESMMPDFTTNFSLLTGHQPFPWQERLFYRFCDGDVPQSCSLPTGLGKTSVIAIWLLALACCPSKLPRRLIYVVNRRTVVDQATNEVELLRRNLTSSVGLTEVAAQLGSLCALPTTAPLAISTLRGQHADNAEWSADPARPAAILGTVDMIGSRLLFSGYGRGFKSRPLHAGFLGQDALLVHDEAHLEPAFQQLVESIVAEQQRCREYRRLRLMELTATSRGGGTQFSLDERDRENEIVRKRIGALKGLVLHGVDNDKAVADEVARQALALKGTGAAVLVYVRTLEDLAKVETTLRKDADLRQNICLLTGTLRGLERDSLAASNPVFARFATSTSTSPQTGAVYLLCTSAGEVGVNISADHVVCDLSSFDSMAQRFGRVNRFGKGNAEVHVVHPNDWKERTFGKKTETESVEGDSDEIDSLPVMDQARLRTLWLLQSLPTRDDGRRDASPSALAGLDVNARQLAFAPAPAILPTTDVLLDAWAMTSIRERLPGRPPVGPWLHGVADWQPRETQVAWREEVQWVTGALLRQYPPQDLLDDYPVKPHEILRDRTERVEKSLTSIAERHPTAPVWVVSPDGSVNAPLTMETLVQRDRYKKFVIPLEDCLVLLSPEVGGLSDGLLKGDVAEAEEARGDVADQWRDEKSLQLRLRIMDDEENADEDSSPMRLVRTIELPVPSDSDGDDESERTIRRWNWYVRPREADDDGSRSAFREQVLSEHLHAVTHCAACLSGKLSLGDTESKAIILAATWHDRGKSRAIWQRSIGNRDCPTTVLAKSGAKQMRFTELGGYRHEFGSILDFLAASELVGLDHDVRELALHLIAAHHGRGRPHFCGDEAYDAEHDEETRLRFARSVPGRFAKLQRRYGRWGLAFIESIVRAADALVSANEYPELPPQAAASVEVAS